ADLRTGPDQLRSGLPVLARQEAVVVLADAIMSAERIALLGDGADHVARSGEPAEVVAMLSAVLRRSRPPAQRPPDQRRAGGIWVDVVQRTAQVRGRPLVLTAREFDLLAYFVTNPGAVLSREKLLADVWGWDVGCLSTVTVHVRRLRRKLEADPAAPEYIKTIWGMGYRLDPSPLR
ncbi:MAG: response regulator transcription factor, partial [Actinomycetota bacterium]|nr:response regulator transcription factor [Actinomycetota bacterium]